MTSILQCINQIKPLTQYFLCGDYVRDMNKENPLKSVGRVTTAHASLSDDTLGEEYSIMAPRLLKQMVSCIAPQFNNKYQYDR